MPLSIGCNVQGGSGGGVGGAGSSRVPNTESVMGQEAIAFAASAKLSNAILRLDVPALLCSLFCGCSYSGSQCHCICSFIKAMYCTFAPTGSPLFKKSECNCVPSVHSNLISIVQMYTYRP